MRVLGRNVPPLQEREFFIETLLVRIHFIIVMIRWTGLAPWECEVPCWCRFVLRKAVSGHSDDLVRVRVCVCV